MAAQAYQIGYHSKKSDDLTIHLYFDRRHLPAPHDDLLHDAGIRICAPRHTSGVADITQTAKQKETRYTIEERFSDFKTSEGLTLPSKYVIHFTQELQNGTTEVYEWDIRTDEVSNNVGLDPRNFQIK